MSHGVIEGFGDKSFVDDTIGSVETTGGSGELCVDESCLCFFEGSARTLYRGECFKIRP